MEILQAALTLFVDNRVMIGPEVCGVYCARLKTTFVGHCLLSVSHKYPIVNFEPTSTGTGLQVEGHTSQPIELAFSLVHS